MPKVSVTTPVYNCANFVGEAIQSVLGQTFQDFGLIVVDDGSTDTTREALGSFKDPRVKYMHQKNQGQSAATNRAIGASTREYVAFLDDDDLWLPEKLELQVKAIESAPQIGVVYCDICCYDSASGRITRTFFNRLNRPPPRGKVVNQFVESFFGTPSTLLVKRGVFAQVGTFDETLLRCQDNDMLFRMASFFEFEVVPLLLIKHRVHAGQKSRNNDLVLRYYIAYLNKAMQSSLLDNKRRTILRRSLADGHFRYAERLIRRDNLSGGGWELLASFRADGPRFFHATLLLCNGMLFGMLAFLRAHAFRWGRSQGSVNRA